jgi:predicted Rossmann fold flavoprotein
MEAQLPIVVIGAGAAGLMAAIFAASGSAPVLLLERTRDGGRKIMISGGGRCNVLPSSLSAGQYFTESSPNTLRKILLSWPLVEQRRFFEHDLGIPLALENESGKLFPASNRARDVRDALVERARERGVRIRFDSTVRSMTPPSGTTRWVVGTDMDSFEAGAVIVATGGLSVPATGSDGAGLRMLGELGHTIHETYPALTPLTAEPPVHAALAGVSLHARLSVQAGRAHHATEGGFLFTHRGYSGPAVLDISHHAVLARMHRRPQVVRVQWTEHDAGALDAMLREGGSAQVGTLMRRILPTRLADVLMAEAKVDAQTSLAKLRREERQALVDTVTRYSLPWTGDEGYRKAEVTGGGVDLGEVDARTLQSRLHARLFICGEALDAFGPIGGYNFAWAWATGRAAGLGAAKALQER